MHLSRSLLEPVLASPSLSQTGANAHRPEPLARAVSSPALSLQDLPRAPQPQRELHLPAAQVSVPP